MIGSVNTKSGKWPMKYEKLTLGVKGKDVTVDSVRINNNLLIVTGHLIKMASIKDELYEDIDNPELLVKMLRDIKPRPDIFTFWQRLPETNPKYGYPMEWESIAALPIKSYNDWFQNQIGKDTRKLVRRAEKRGCVVKSCTFDDEFIKGMTNIFNESPIRQGRPFWHYGKDYATIKREFSRYLFREELLGAFYEGELIGFIFLAYAEKYAYLGQIISKIEHRDKYTNNALISKAVEIAAMKNMPFLVYGLWPRGGLEEFKRRNGFQKIDVPRYYVPLTRKGVLALKLNVHRGVIGIVPEGLRLCLREFRQKWYERKYRY
jgi:hypothetical protein